MKKSYRLEFVGPSGIVKTSEIRAANARAALEVMNMTPWPPKATLLRLIDLDGTVLAERGRD